MKTRLVTVVALSAVMLALVASATSARQSEPYTMYMPFVTKPPCVPARATIYLTVNRPVFRIGDVVTAVAALMNECAPVGSPALGLIVQHHACRRAFNFRTRYHHRLYRSHEDRAAASGKCSLIEQFCWCERKLEAGIHG